MDCDEIEENVKTNYFELFDFEQYKYLFNDEAKSLFSANHHYILFAGLGNFVGSFMAMNVSEYLEQEKKHFK